MNPMNPWVWAVALIFSLVVFLVSQRMVQLERTNRRTRERLSKWGRVNKIVKK